MANGAICNHTPINLIFPLFIRDRHSPGTLFVGFITVLQPKQVLVFTANFISPPTVGVAICIVLVWSPDTMTDGGLAIRASDTVEKLLT